ncbi:MAG: hypothetical protein SH819_14965 [Cytophagales bacterium]|nr:hypothetical protein [Cytophagales bacterium]
MKRLFSFLLFAALVFLALLARSTATAMQQSSGEQPGANAPDVLEWVGKSPKAF